MAKELLETFEIAKKAADLAASFGGGSEEIRCVDAIRRLRSIPVNTDLLRSTQLGRQVRSLTKNPREMIKSASSELLAIWKNKVVEEASEKINKNNSNGQPHTILANDASDEVVTASSAKIGKSQTEARNTEKVEPEAIKTEKPEKLLRAESVTGANANKVVKISGSEHVKIEKVDRCENGRIHEVENKSSARAKRPFTALAGQPKLTSMVKCNDSIRDKLRELIAEALSKVSSEAGADIIDEVNACDPIRVAVMVESTMFEKLGRSNGAQKVKYRSIMFNLKDGNNPDLRRKVLLGQVKPEQLIEMKPEEMASDQRKRENMQIKEKAMFECERAAAPKATTDQFKCGRCGQRKTTYYQLQTRSADEPMTTFVTCVNCNNHWKFC